MISPTYGEHITLAARYAALALTVGRPKAAEVPALLVLRDDLVVNLAGLVRELSHPTRTYRRHGSLTMLAQDPVAALTTRLALLPQLGDLDRPAPSQRFADRPASPTQVLTTTGAWKGLAIETMLALDCLHRGRVPLSDPARWTAIGDLAVLAEAIDPLDQTLLPTMPGPGCTTGCATFAKPTPPWPWRPARHKPWPAGHATTRRRRPSYRPVPDTSYRSATLMPYPRR